MEEISQYVSVSYETVLDSDGGESSVIITTIDTLKEFSSVLPSDTVMSHPDAQRIIESYYKESRFGFYNIQKEDGGVVDRQYVFEGVSSEEVINYLKGRGFELMIGEKNLPFEPTIQQTEEWEPMSDNEEEKPENKEEPPTDDQEDRKCNDEEKDTPQSKESESECDEEEELIPEYELLNQESSDEEESNTTEKEDENERYKRYCYEQYNDDYDSLIPELHCIIS